MAGVGGDEGQHHGWLPGLAGGAEQARFPEHDDDFPSHFRGRRLGRAREQAVQIQQCDHAAIHADEAADGEIVHLGDIRRQGADLPGADRQDIRNRIDQDADALAPDRGDYHHMAGGRVGQLAAEAGAQVVHNATPGGGMEAASTPAYSDRSVTGKRTRRWQHVIIHEIAHQWFGNAVTEFHWNDVWLSEGFATYYTLLFRQHLYGHDDFIEGLKGARNTVVNFYEDDYDFQIVRDYLDDLNNVSGAMMYSKGAWTLHMLREQVGVEAYNAGIRSYYAEFMNRNAQTADLRRHMEETSGQNLEQFFNQWLFQGGIPELQGSWRFNHGELVIKAEQVQDTYDFDLNVDFLVEFADGSSETITLVVGPDEQVRGARSFEREVTNVTVDPNTRLLAKWTFGKE